MPYHPCDTAFLYGEKALEKLNAILFLRELDMPLDTIKEVVNSKDSRYATVLKDYRESALHPEVTVALQEELKNIYFAFRDSSGNDDEEQEFVKRLEENTEKMFRTANARFILLKVAEGYLKNEKSAQVIDSVYGMGVAEKMGKAIHGYYGK